MFEDSQVTEYDPQNQNVEIAAELFAMLSDPTRIRIVLILSSDERSVNEIAEFLDKAPTTVSQHLAKLRMARLVATRHEGNRVFYRLANDHARQLVQDALHQSEHTTGGPLRHDDSRADR
ncbi:metalloregulator ArsR/SmtB family transcription factor [Herbiconiux sp. L3-i23]|uniref:ArsR/SmtB family transcription factor n=1 Tax=Herbiconiux sp. L3-i23 TaxID=2905871 RepID=UPI002072C214|nr:metalloregulator ArsR/SmtB family transcription factor [Herbiconiux sp. L3-i23]